MKKSHLSKIHRLVVATFACALTFLLSGTAPAQSITDGSTPLALSPGAPAGSYALSDFDSVNMYNGNLSFSLPLVKIGGRGGAGYTMFMRLEHKWLVEKEVGTPNHYYPNPNWWNVDAFDSIYSMGRMDVRQGGSVDYELHCSAYIHSKTLTRMTFTAPDGTEFELRDQATNGQPNHPTCSTGFNRGKIFVTADGSSATFTSDDDISDYIYDNPANVPPSGYLTMRDGTRYRIFSGLVEWMRDRNGNKVTFTYNTSRLLTGVTDSLNRRITISYADGTTSYDTITLKGFEGTTRTIKVYHAFLEDSLRSDCSLLSYSTLFPELNGAAGSPGGLPVISAVELPNGQQYQFSYNSYAELARVVLPTGGAFEYDYAAGLTDGAASGVLPSYNGDKHVYRRVIERRVYPEGGTGTSYANRTTYSRPETGTTNAGYVVADQRNSYASDTLMNRSRHYYYGSARASFNQQPTEYGGWKDGREYQTIVYAADGTTALRQSNSVFEQCAAVSWWTGSADLEPPNDPRLIESDTSLVDANQVSKQVFGYDDSVPYNNQNNVKEYAFGTGSAGGLLRETRTTFVTSSSYTDPDVSLLGLPSQVSVFDGDGIERARTTLEYDNYASDTNHAALVSRSSISGLDSAFTTSLTTRGNVTATTHSFLNDSGTATGSVSGYAQYDVAGNVVKAIDARGNATTIDFGDRFGAPSGEAEANTSPTELSTPGKTSFAFATKVTNALGQIAYVQFDYYLGKPVDAEDVNGIVTSGYYDDVLDRPTQVRRAVGVSGMENQTTFGYNDTDHIITTTSDQATNNDNVLVGKTLYDKLGRTTESRQYEGGTNYIVAQTQYDDLGRAYKHSNPFRPWNSETAVWTTSAFDALGRVTSVTTPDSAVVNSYFYGNQVLVQDQAGKERMSQTNALGQLSDVWEITASDSATESITFTGHSEVAYGYRTKYDYNTLGNLITVTQRIGASGSTQTRSLVYDSLSRLASAANPESGTISYTYDNGGNLLTKTDARSIVSTYVYDALNRPTSRSYSDSTPTVTYSYDSTSITNGIGRLSSTSSSVSSYGYSGYDALGRATGGSQTTSSHSYSVGYTYDKVGHVLTETYPSGNKVTNTYDSAGRETSVVGNLGSGGTDRDYATGIIYDAASRMTKEQFGTTTAIYNKLFYNVRGQLAEIRESTSYTGPTDTSFNRGAIINFYSSCWGMCGGSGSTTPMTENNGNLLRQEVYIPDNDDIPTTSFHQLSEDFEYDSLNRLHLVHDGTAWKQQYDYDRYGNRSINSSGTSGTGINSMQMAVVPSTITNRMYAPGETESSHPTMDYDAAGNQTKDTYSGEAVSRAYDAENRMTSETQASSYVAGTYSYDGDGRRVKRVFGGVETWQVYGLGGELLAEYAANASYTSPQKEYGYRNGQLLVTATIGTGWGSPPTYTAPDPLVAGVGIKLEHLTELRTAVNQLRSHAGLAAATFTVDPTPVRYTTEVKADHILQLRAALEGARAHLGLSTGGYTHSGLTVGDPIYAIDFQELRDQIASAWSAVRIQWLVSDQLGTPRMIFEESGSLATVSRHDYLPFGEELFAGTGGRATAQGYTNNDVVRHKFTQKERDIETGLDYFLARYYSSTQGRFTSPDEFQGGPRELFALDTTDREKQPLAYSHILSPQSLNKYQYCMNNPLRYIDPDGHDWRIAEERDEHRHRVRRYVWDDNYTYKKGDKNGAASNASYIDTKGQVIKLWGENGKSHGYQTVTVGEPGANKESKYTDQKGAPPSSYITLGDTERALRQAGYQQIVDPFHESSSQHETSNSPTLHLIVFFNLEIVQGPKISATEYSTLQVAVVDRIEYHRDDHTQIGGDLEKHMWEATKQVLKRAIP